MKICEARLCAATHHLATVRAMAADPIRDLCGTLNSTASQPGNMIWPIQRICHLIAKTGTTAGWLACVVVPVETDWPQYSRPNTPAATVVPPFLPRERLRPIETPQCSSKISLDLLFTGGMRTAVVPFFGLLLYSPGIHKLSLMGQFASGSGTLRHLPNGLIQNRLGNSCRRHA